MAGSTAQVTHFAAFSRLLGKTIKQFSIERLMLKFIENSIRILLRKPIVVLAKCFNAVVRHAAQPRGNTPRPTFRKEPLPTGYLELYQSCRRLRL